MPKSPVTPRQFAVEILTTDLEAYKRSLSLSLPAARKAVDQAIAEVSKLRRAPVTQPDQLSEQRVAQELRTIIGGVPGLRALYDQHHLLRAEEMCERPGVKRPRLSTADPAPARPQVTRENVEAQPSRTTQAAAQLKSLQQRPGASRVPHTPSSGAPARRSAAPSPGNAR